jgi:hypothetical protein
MVSFIEDMSNLLERHGKNKNIPPKKVAKYVESCLRALDKVTEKAIILAEKHVEVEVSYEQEERPVIEPGSPLDIRR